MPEYIVQQGDCISSIAVQNGLTWQKIWNHPKNSALKRLRDDPNVLYPGDVVFVPDKENQDVACATEQRHRFIHKGVPAVLRLVLQDYDGKPRSDEPYVLDIDGKVISGKTDGDGKIEQRIPPNARQGTLKVGPEKSEIYALRLGHTDPATELTGVQSRLNNLGYDCGPVDGSLSAETKIALQAFQRKHGLEETGEPDEATQNKLKEVHGS